MTIYIRFSHMGLGIGAWANAVQAPAVGDSVNVEGTDYHVAHIHWSVGGRVADIVVSLPSEHGNNS